MASYTRVETIVRRIAYQVPSGDAMGEFDKAYNAALADYRRRNGKTDTDRVYDDWATVEAHDDTVDIILTVEEKPGVADERLKRVREAYAELVRRANTDSGGRPDGALDDTDLELIRKALDGEG